MNCTNEVTAYLIYQCFRGKHACVCEQWGRTALMCAATQNNLELAKVLIQNGANVNVTTKVSIFRASHRLHAWFTLCSTGTRLCCARRTTA